MTQWKQAPMPKYKKLGPGEYFAPMPQYKKKERLPPVTAEPKEIVELVAPMPQYKKKRKYKVPGAE